MKISLDIGSAREAILCNTCTLKSISDGGITECWRVGTRVEASSGVVRGDTNFDLRKTCGYELIRCSGKRDLIANVNVCDGSCSMFIRIFDHRIGRGIETN